MITLDKRFGMLAAAAALALGVPAIAVADDETPGAPPAAATTVNGQQTGDDSQFSQEDKVPAGVADDSQADEVDQAGEDGDTENDQEGEQVDAQEGQLSGGTAGYPGSTTSATSPGLS